MSTSRTTFAVIVTSLLLAAFGVGRWTSEQPLCAQLSPGVVDEDSTPASVGPICTKVGWQYRHLQFEAAPPTQYVQIVEPGTSGVLHGFQIGYDRNIRGYWGEGVGSPSAIAKGEVGGNPKAPSMDVRFQDGLWVSASQTFSSNPPGTEEATILFQTSPNGPRCAWDSLMVLTPGIRTQVFPPGTTGVLHAAFLEYTPGYVGEGLASDPAAPVIGSSQIFLELVGSVGVATEVDVRFTNGLWMIGPGTVIYRLDVPLPGSPTPE